MGLAVTGPPPEMLFDLRMDACCRFPDKPITRLRRTLAAHWRDEDILFCRA
jgi:hypothetical protein